MIYAYIVYYRGINQETYESELKSCTCELEIIPVTTDEYGEELEDTVDVEYMYEIIEDGELLNGIYKEDEKDSDNWAIEINGSKENEQSLGMIIDGIQMFSSINIENGDRLRIFVEKKI